MVETFFDTVIKARKKCYPDRLPTYDDFKIGDRVEVIVPWEDCYFFYGETGIIIKNSHEYLGIVVKFDNPRNFEGGYVQETFNFKPEDLFKIGQDETTKACPCCGAKLK